MTSTKYAEDNEQVTEFNMITSDQYNTMTTNGRKSMISNIVEFSDGKLYQISKSGGLKRFKHSIPLNPEEQQKLSQRYQTQRRHEIQLAKQERERRTAEDKGKLKITTIPSQSMPEPQHGESISI